MSNHRITRNSAKGNPDLQQEVDDFNPFAKIDKVVNSPARITSSLKKLEEESHSIPKTIDINSKEETTLKLDTYVNTHNNIKMSVTPQSVSLKDALRIIPEFDGKNIPLSQFLDDCTEALAMIDEASEKNLTRLIRSKISGEARSSISGQNFENLDELKQFLKIIYSPSKSVIQLLGELGKEFQRNDEAVISFSNRIKALGQKIIETKKLEGAVSEAFKTSIEESMIECFKAGLKPEIEQRLTNKPTVIEMLQEAIRVERLLQTRRNLRREDDSTRLRYERRRINVCQICNQDTHDTRDCKSRLFCKLCNTKGHSTDNCHSISKNRCNECNKIGHQTAYCPFRKKCQICNRPGHEANECFKIINCQLCNLQGHTALYCRTNKSKGPSLKCQLCFKDGHSATNCSLNRSETKFNTIACSYCKRSGHNISDCRKRIFNEATKSGNGQSPQTSSAKAGTQSFTQRRSMNISQIQNTEDAELIALSSNLRLN